MVVTRPVLAVMLGSGLDGGTISIYICVYIVLYNICIYTYMYICTHACKADLPVLSSSHGNINGS